MSVHKEELTFDIGDAFIMWCYELVGGRRTMRKLKTSF
jgi:hypothetical protein